MGKFELWESERKLISKFVNGDGERDVIQSKKDGPVKMTLENNTLTLYQTRIAEKEGGRAYIMEAPKKDVPGRLYGDARRSTAGIIEFLRGELEERQYSLITVPFELDYHGSLETKYQGGAGASPHGGAESGGPSDLCRNVIFSGTPGAGKSYFVDYFAIPELLAQIPIPAGQTKEEFYQAHTTRVTFTEGYTREDFFGCYKPVVKRGTQQITYDFVPGPFCRAVCAALLAPGENHILVIEELNRGNVYEIFGDIFQLLDRGADGRSSYFITLSLDARIWFEDEFQRREVGCQFDGDHFRLPGNLYIICTMNNADARVQFLDTAFKRRFSNVYIDEESRVYAADNIPGIARAREDPEMRGAVFCVQDFLSREAYDRIRRRINAVLQNEGYPEDKLLAAHFVRFGRNPDGTEGLREMEFITSVLGYLLQNVFRGRERSDGFLSIFKEDCPRSMGLLLKKYCEDRRQGIGLDGILMGSILE